MSAIMHVANAALGRPAPQFAAAASTAVLRYPETDLRRRLVAGEEAAFEELVRRFGGRMLATARRFLPQGDDARDAVQEAFLSAFKAIDSFGGNAKLSTWLHRITVNAALMKIRARRRRSEQSIDELLPEFDERGEWVSGAGSWHASSDVLLEDAQTRMMVRRCIDRLPERYRTVLLLRDIEDLDTDEVAEMLGITGNAVKVRLHRARQALRTLVERQMQSAEDHHGEPSGGWVRNAPAMPCISSNESTL